MPLYEYVAREPERASCAHCRQPFECLRKLADPLLTKCPQCGAPIMKIFSAPAVGRSQTSFDDRAKSAGFHKLQKLSKGEYEKKY
jgi:putative FmdB family regulatory protein